MFGYSILRSTQNQPFFDALLADLRAFGVPLEGLHCETGPGVLEAAILYSDALTAADRAVLFKSSAKEIGHRFGILPSFMARWNTDLPGCSGHAHQSLWSPRRRQGTSTNEFFDDGDPRRMSDTFRSYLAGQLALLPGDPGPAGPDGEQLQATGRRLLGARPTSTGASTTARWPAG